VIQSFLDAWPLFHNAFLAGFGIAFVLALLGIVVVARDQIFVGVAMSQASMLGIAVAMWGGGFLADTAVAWLGAEEASALWAVAFSVGCALAAARAEARGGETHEAITGWVFLAAGSISILILAHSPHGVEEIHRLVASSLIGAEQRDVIVFGVLAAVLTIVTARLRPQVMLYAMDPTMAVSVGMPVRTVSLLYSLALGVGVGLSIRVSGMLYTFGCLVLPAMAAKSLCREVRQMFWVAPAIGVWSAVVAFVVANHEDYPPAQMTVAVQSAAVVACWSIRWVRNVLARAPRQPAGSVK
jgi:ABC-type Mn2+/Zn2+ transport system permease subunit